MGFFCTKKGSKHTYAIYPPHTGLTYYNDATPVTHARMRKQNLSENSSGKRLFASQTMLDNRPRFSPNFASLIKNNAWFDQFVGSVERNKLVQMTQVEQNSCRGLIKRL